MKRVVERCATCGVEHEVRVDACEACGGALRYWCRTHSRQAGWLESPECRGCAEEKSRPVPPRRPAPDPRKAPKTRRERREREARRERKARRKREVRRPVEAPAPTPAIDWEGPGARVVVFTMLSAWIPCIVFFTLLALIGAPGSIYGVGELALRGAGAGWVVGLMLGIMITTIRLSR